MDIKFRAWDNGELITMDQMSHAPGDLLVSSLSDILNFYKNIEQFTGHFATGQEIYDGDIITHPDADFPVRVYQGEFGEWLTQGEIDSYGGTLEEWAPDECTIIGNINETPELLEVSE